MVASELQASHLALPRLSKHRAKKAEKPSMERRLVLAVLGMGVHLPALATALFLAFRDYALAWLQIKDASSTKGRFLGSSLPTQVRYSTESEGPSARCASQRRRARCARHVRALTPPVRTPRAGPHARSRAPRKQKTSTSRWKKNIDCVGE